MARLISAAILLLLLCGAAPAPPKASQPAKAAQPAPVVLQVERACPPGQDDRASDLCAQWKAADAAFLDAQWTERSFWLGLIGTLVGGGTLVAAFAAARYARDAAREARRSANIAKDAFAANERAWITVDIRADSDLTISRTGGCGMFVALTVKNIGKTPALNVHTNMTMVPSLGFERGDVATFALENRVRDETSSRTLLPGESYDRPWGLHLDDVHDVLYGVVIGCVTYETLPDRTLHQTTFSYYLGRGDVGGIDNRDIPQSDVKFTVTTGGFAD